MVNNHSLLVEQPPQELRPREHDLGVVAPDLGGAALNLLRLKDNAPNISQAFTETLAPERRAEEKERLLQDEADSTSDSRYTSASFAGFMEAKPKSIIFKSSDTRAKEVLESVCSSPVLQERHFVDKDELLNKADEARVIKIKRTPGDPPIELPLGNFVSADAFKSWEEGRGKGYTKREEGQHESQGSKDILYAYASRTTEAPPIESVVGLVQPNGLVVYIAAQGSHRTGAAIIRGDKTIKTNNLELMPVEVDYFKNGTVAE
jgi:hypothetical protein